MTAASAILDLRPETGRGESAAAPGRTEADRLGALTSRLGAGDEAAWTAFHEAYAPRLFRYLLVVTGGREDLAAEALQQTWIRCVRHMRRFESEEALWSWLTVLARSALTDEHRRHSRWAGFLQRVWERLRFGESVAPPAAPDPNPEALLELAMNGLSAEERGLIEARYFDRRALRDLAAESGITEKAMESRLARLRCELREQVLRLGRRMEEGE